MILFFMITMKKQFLMTKKVSSISMIFRKDQSFKHTYIFHNCRIYRIKEFKIFVLSIS